MRQIFPAANAAPEIGAGLDAVAALAGLYAYPPSPPPWLRANMVTSVDGAGWLDGRTSGLSGAADRLVFSVLRSLADVILVGSRTVRDEKYRPVRESEVWPALREGRPPTSPIAVVTGGSGLDPDGPLLGTAGAARTIVLTTEAAPARWRAAVAARAEVIVAGRDRVTPAAAVEALAGHGYLRILTEGGPSLLSQIAAAGLLHDLCLTYSPVLEGGQAGRIVTPGGGPAWDMRLRLAHVLEDEGYLLCRYLQGAGGREVR